MKVSEEFPSKWLKAANLNGKDVNVTISHISKEDVGDDSGHKMVVYFSGTEKGLVLNKTNADMISMLYGDDTDGWHGQKITLYAIQTEYQGKPVQGLRVKMTTVQVNPQAMPVDNTPPVASRDDFDDEIPF